MLKKSNIPAAKPWPTNEWYLLYGSECHSFKDNNFVVVHIAIKRLWDLIMILI
jgi:hypothetical protein